MRFELGFVVERGLVHPLRVLAVAGGRVERSCLIGDSITDHTTARAAGVPSVLVDFGLADQDMAALEPDALITSFEDLPKALANLGL